MTGNNDIFDEDCKAEEEEYAERQEDVPPGGRASFDSEQLADESEHRFSHIFII